MKAASALKQLDDSIWQGPPINFLQSCFAGRWVMNSKGRILGGAWALRALRFSLAPTKIRFQIRG